MKLTIFQKLCSFFYPVLIRRTSSQYNPVLDLYYYRGRWQLATADALYSDGIYYRPLVSAFHALDRFLPEVKNVLVLGTGLGSAVQILHKKGCKPVFTLVELDKQVLALALELMPEVMTQKIQSVCADAQQFLPTDTALYDLLIVDIFNGRQVPDFVLSNAFIAECRQHLSPQGYLVLNYMIHSREDAQKAKAALEAAFDQVKEIELGINRVYIATA